MTINTYFVIMLLKTILEMSYNTYTGVDTASERSYGTKCFTCHAPEKVWSNFIMST